MGTRECEEEGDCPVPLTTGEQFYISVAFGAANLGSSDLFIKCLKAENK